MNQRNAVWSCTLLVVIAVGCTSCGVRLVVTATRQAGKINAFEPDGFGDLQIEFDARQDVRPIVHIVKRIRYCVAGQ